jgi:hypothetical protein
MASRIGVDLSPRATRGDTAPPRASPLRCSQRPLDIGRFRQPTIDLSARVIGSFRPSGECPHVGVGADRTHHVAGRRPMESKPISVPEQFVKRP